MANKNKKYIAPVVIGILVIALGALGYFYYNLSKELSLTKIELQNTKSDLTQSEEKGAYLAANLESEQSKNALFAGQISDISGTVGTLDKLAKTDKELLQKYSKIYFLNEHYAPDSLTDLPPDYVYEKDKKMQLHTKVYPYFQLLITDAAKDGIDLKLVSAYRSFGEQNALKTGYTLVYGTGANKFSADQGYSEHQLGTTVDFTTPEIGAGFTKFKSTDAYEWLQANAYKYGFILSYPEGNTYYQFEPWHWRFVGRALAERMYEEKENFYDLDQNKIDAYLVKLFD